MFERCTPFNRSFSPGGELYAEKAPGHLDSAVLYQNALVLGIDRRHEKRIQRAEAALADFGNAAAPFRPGTGAGAATFGQVLKSAIIPALGVGMMTGALDGAGEKIGNASVFKGNDTNSAFDAASYMIDGHQVVTDAHGNPIIDANGNYQTMDGNFINAKTGAMTDANGNSIGGVNVNRQSTLGNNNTIGAMTRKNFLQQGILQSAGHFVENGGLSNFGTRSIFGRMVTRGGTGSTWAQRLGSSKFVTTARSWGSGLATRAGRLGQRVAQSRFVQGIGNIGSRIAQSKFGQAVGKAGQSISNGVGGFATKLGEKMSKSLRKIGDLILKNETVSKLLGSVRNKIDPFIEKLSKNFDDYFVKTNIEANGTMTTKFLKELDEFLGVLKVLIIAKAIVDGWTNAPTYLGVVTRWDELPTLANVMACIINVINQLIPFIGGFIPTETLFNLFNSAATAVAPDSKWIQDWNLERQEAFDIVSQYNAENGTNYDIAAYNQAMKNCSPLTLAGQYWKEDVGELTNTVKNDGLLQSAGNIANGMYQSIKENGLLGESARFMSEAATDNFMVRAGQDFDANYGLSHAVDEGIANGNVAAMAYDKAMTNLGGVVVGASDTVKNVYNGAKSIMPWNWGKGSGLVAGKGTSKSDNFVSQMDPRYSSIRVGTSSVNENGSAPAVASMVASDYGKNLTMQAASSKASKYQQGQEGTTVNYFGDTLAEQGIGTSVLPSIRHIVGSLGAGNSVILLGQDANNSSKDVSPFGPTNHYVLASGLDKSGNIIIKDPENNKPVTYDPSILGSTSMAIGTTFNAPSQRIRGGSILGGGRIAKPTIGRSIRRAGNSIRNGVAKVGNAGKNLFNNAKNFLGRAFGKGSKGQAFPAEIWSWLHQTMGLNDYQTAAIQG